MAHYRLAMGMLITALTVWPAAMAAADDDIVGLWLTDGGKSRVEIAKVGDTYTGTIVWLSEPDIPAGEPGAGTPKVDKENPDPAKRTQPVIGLRILKGLKRSGNGNWDKGTVYDPENGKTYRCKAALKSKDTLALRGFIGISLIGRTTEWTRWPADKKAAAK